MVNGQWSMVNGQWSIYRSSKIKSLLKISFQRKFACKNSLAEIHGKNLLSLIFKKFSYNQRTFMLHHAQHNFCFGMKR